MLLEDQGPARLKQGRNTNTSSLSADGVWTAVKRHRVLPVEPEHLHRLMQLPVLPET